ncbi:alpha/beta hydrolase [Rhodobacteraceae bacterium]|nr:alpha/beta hydrolase [Paracoccaceae bacterium]
MESAPFHNDLAEGPDNVEAFWRRASDGVRLRVVHWPAGSSRGTILLFSGRTEYAEKYGQIASELTESGYSVVTIDWRGQGLSDRVAEDIRLGHVGSFDDYQLDVAEVVGAARDLGCPEPWFMIAHSMGGSGQSSKTYLLKRLYILRQCGGLAFRFGCGHCPIFCHKFCVFSALESELHQAPVL